MFLVKCLTDVDETTRGQEKHMPVSVSVPNETTDADMECENYMMEQIEVQSVVSSSS